VVLVNCDRSSWNMDPDLLARELEQAGERGKLPRAVVPTDLYGQCADYDRIFSVCDRFHVPVVVDAILGCRK
jgi:dTDP-4-amino-4,6-dideoxygalactose transaminase